MFNKVEIIKKWMVQSKEGKDIFFFELYYSDDNKECIWFDTNLTLPGRYKKLIDVLEILLTKKLSMDEIEVTATSFLEMAKGYKSLRKYYYPENCLDIHGRLHEPTYNTLQRREFLEKKIETKLLEPYSEEFNVIIFRKIKKHFYSASNEIIAKSKEIARVDFERTLKELNVRSLDQAYIAIYSRKNKNRYYLYIDEDSKESTFLVFSGNKLLLFFDKVTE